MVIMCPHCHHLEFTIVLDQYHFTECGLDNIYLLFCKITKCGCGVRGIWVPLNSVELYKPMVWELIYNKPGILDSFEFTGIINYLFDFAMENDDFCKLIGFQNRDLIKSNDLSKLAKLKTEGEIQKELQENFCTKDDVLINEECAKEIRNCVALKLGFLNEKELLEIGIEKPITSELDKKLRELAKKAVVEIKFPHASSINNHSGNQIIYVDLKESI